MRAAVGRALALAFVAATAGASGGCGNFDDVTSVKDLRVLAMATEPSEIILEVVRDPVTGEPVLDPATDLPMLVPGSNPTIMVQPLLAGAAPDATVTWTLVACPNNPAGAAPPQGGGGAMLGGGARSTVGSALCPDDASLPASVPARFRPVTIPLVADPAAAGAAIPIRIPDAALGVAFVLDAFPDQFGHRHGGLDLGEPYTLQLTATDGVQTLTAIKRVLFWAAAVNADQRPNNTPYISELQAFGRRDDDNGELVEPLGIVPERQPFPVTAGTTVWIKPDEAEAEPYVTTVLDRDSHLAVPLNVARERIRYAYYASAGTFQPARTVNELPPGFVGTVHVESKYTPPAKTDTLPLDPDGRPLVTIWVVVRDERGGESWQQRTLAIVPPSP